MGDETQGDAGTASVDYDADRIAMLARKATRKASRIANKDGFFVERADGACVVRSPGPVVKKLEVKTTPIDVRKHYTFAL